MVRNENVLLDPISEALCTGGADQLDIISLSSRMLDASPTTGIRDAGIMDESSTSGFIIVIYAG